MRFSKGVAFKMLAMGLRKVLNKGNLFATGAFIKGFTSRKKVKRVRESFIILFASDKQL